MNGGRHRDLSVEDLAELMTWSLERRGFTAGEVAAYLEAQRLSGWLRPNCPAWIRNSAGVHFALPHEGGQSSKVNG